MNDELLYRDAVYYLQGLGFQIHTALGGGHAEIDYENALVHALELDNRRYVRQPVYRVNFRGQQVGEYRPDLVVEDGGLLLELKAVPRIEAMHVAQTISYLAVTNARLGLIMNFGGGSMEHKRVPNFLDQRQRSARTVVPPENLLHPTVAAATLDELVDVHRSVGPGFLHQVYRRAAIIALRERGLSVRLIKALPLRFRGATLATKSVRLLLVEDKLLIATVALRTVVPAHPARLRWAMRETGIQLGLIANFFPTALAFQFYRQNR